MPSLRFLPFLLVFQFPIALIFFKFNVVCVFYMLEDVNEMPASKQITSKKIELIIVAITSEKGDVTRMKINKHTNSLLRNILCYFSN